MENLEPNPKLESSVLRDFSFEGKSQPVSFVETVYVAEGVECDVYQFSGDPSKDLGIIRIGAGKNTPLQKVLKGDKTLEGFISGKGKLTVVKADGEREIYLVEEGSEKPVEVVIKIGEIMQWEADRDSGLVAYEICFPPYEDGRYENIT